MVYLMLASKSQKGIYYRHTVDGGGGGVRRARFLPHLEQGLS